MVQFVVLQRRFQGSDVNHSFVSLVADNCVTFKAGDRADVSKVLLPHTAPSPSSSLEADPYPIAVEELQLRTARSFRADLSRRPRGRR